MTYRDLPADWQQRPLTDPVLAADVLDLFTDRRSRQERALILVLCDCRGHALAPVIIDALPADPIRARFGARLGSVLQHFDGLRLVAGYARPGPQWPTPADLLWQSAVAAACAEVELLSFAVLDTRGCHPLPRIAEPERPGDPDQLAG